ncbi:MAG: cytochrome c maturation protein CcmE [Endozoicomonadaceae bacterium]|nr:cytochrome c maturation protein CcmE [Endozoicomonadaceae bacterium]
MKAIRQQRLFLLLFILTGAGLAISMAVMALQQNINLYYSPVQMVSQEAPVDVRIRGGGLVVAGTVIRDSESLDVAFDMTDGAGTITVKYSGILPDLFAEGQGVVGAGKLGSDGVFYADEILAKHDSNYMPPEVLDAIDKAREIVAGRDSEA